MICPVISLTFCQITETIIYRKSSFFSNIIKNEKTGENKHVYPSLTSAALPLLVGGILKRRPKGAKSGPPVRPQPADKTKDRPHKWSVFFMVRVTGVEPVTSAASPLLVSGILKWRPKGAGSRPPVRLESLQSKKTQTTKMVCVFLVRVTGVEPAAS